MLRIAGRAASEFFRFPFTIVGVLVASAFLGFLPSPEAGAADGLFLTAFEIGDRVVFQGSNGRVVGFAVGDGTRSILIDFGQSGYGRVGVHVFRHPQSQALRPLIEVGSHVALASGRDGMGRGIVASLAEGSVEVWSNSLFGLGEPVIRRVRPDQVVRASDQQLRDGAQAAFLAARTGLLPAFDRTIEHWGPDQQTIYERLRTESALGGRPEVVDFPIAGAVAVGRRLFEAQVGQETMYVGVMPDGSVELLRLGPSGFATVAGIVGAGSLTRAQAAGFDPVRVDTRGVVHVQGAGSFELEPLLRKASSAPALCPAAVADVPAASTGPR